MASRGFDLKARGHPYALPPKKKHKMENKKKLVIFAFLLFATLIFFNLNNISAVGQPSFCCEKTTQGAWCQNVDDITKCDTSSGLRSVPTSCDATSYCRLGTCVNTQEGVCMENTPQRVCEQPQGGVASGLWFDSKPSEIPQCQLGCCLIGEQAAFTTQTRCEQLSSLYGLNTNYRTDIKNEAQCIASAFPAVKGACVFEDNFQRKCEFITKKECQTLETKKTNVKFSQDFLCSAEVLGTVCGPSQKTTTVSGRDEVFFLDTCGNVANIYDASRQNDRTYWDKIIPKAQSCGFGNSNAGSSTCGNCDYLSGSTGAIYDRFRDGSSSSPNFGNYICRSLDCKFIQDLNGDGNTNGPGESGTFKHGESWCANSAGTGQIISKNGQLVGVPDSTKDNLPGSRYFRLVCYNGDVTVEPCADFRQETCIQSTTKTSQGDFRTAACRANEWVDCVAQGTQKDCENPDKRDCKWTDTGAKDDKGGPISSCLPKFAPGFDFFGDVGNAQQLCAQASATCQVKFVRGVSGKLAGAANAIGGASDVWTCSENCGCVGLKKGDKYSLSQIQTNIQGKNNMCISLGDCGVKNNYIGKNGYYGLGDLTKVSEINGGSGILNKIPGLA